MLRVFSMGRNRPKPTSLREVSLIASLALLALAGCEPEPPATQPWPASPRPYAAAPGQYAAPGYPSLAPWPAATMQRAPAQAPTVSPAHRSMDLSLDVPSGMSAPTIDFRDPWAKDFESRDPPKVAAPPTTHMLVLLAFEKKGNTAARAAAARKLLSSRGGVKRSDWLWEIPTPQADRSPDVMRTELAKLLCDEDHAALFFGAERAVAKLEFSGSVPCEPAPPR